nr:cell wall hydrolase [Pseudomonas sp. TH07]
MKDGITSAIGWLGEENHPGISVHSPHEWVDFSVIEAESQTPAYGSYFLTLAEMAAFQRGEKALQKNQLDTPLQEVFDTLDSHPDGALTLGELQAAQRSRSTLQRLSRIILRYPTEWKADPQAWAHYDAEIPPSNRAAWESEKQRMGELVWWDEVAGKINDFPADQLIFHFHIISFISNMKHPDPDELRHLSMTIYGEARGQNYASKIAIAWAIRNRLESSHWGDTYKSVVTARYQFTCWEKNIDPDGYEAIHNPVGEAWKDSKLAAMEVMQAPQSKNVLSGATNYYSPKSQAALHKTDPKRYPSTPAFANPEKRVPNPNGVSNEDYQFYKP